MIFVLYFVVSAGGLHAESPPKRVGMYQGTFDPPHDGHRVVVTGAQRELDLDLVYVVPFNKSSYKPNKAAVEHRERMVALHFARDSYVRGLTSEMKLSLGEGDVWDFVRIVSQHHPDSQLFNIMGTDVFDWFRTLPAEKRHESSTVVVSARDAETDRPHRIGRQRVVHVDDGAFVNSSTRIRKALLDGKSPDALSPSVLRYIRRNGLYGTERRARTGKKNKLLPRRAHRPSRK